MIETPLVYEQIDSFNTRPSNPLQPKSDSIEKQRLFVVKDTAHKSAAFLGFLFEKNQIIKSKKSNIHNVIDIAYGSGNLTSHILLDNEIDFDKVVFNDKNLETSNKDIINNFEDKAEISAFDFLDSRQFNFDEKFDFVIFNPQTGGKSNYPEGDSKLTATHVINVDDDIEAYLTKQGIDTSNLEITRPSTTEILIESTELSKTDLGDLLKNIKIFDYQDVFYKGKTAATKGGTVSNVVKFRDTFDKVFDENGILVFLGDESLFKTLFGDFNYVLNYWINGKKTDKNIFVAAKTDTRLSICYEKSGNGFLEIPNCEKTTETAEVEGDLDELDGNIKDLMKKLFTTAEDDDIVTTPKEAENKEKDDQKEPKEPFIIKKDEIGNLSYPYKNILLKGVPGTGKSRLINNLITNKLGLDARQDNVLRVNIHSASSNADMMQGIGIATSAGQISYHEKQGLILNHIHKAIEYPFQPFVIVLEEIQENSLNQLIGDLIYLIEDEKRTDIAQVIETLGDTFESIEDFLEQLNVQYFVKVPYLVSTETRYRKLVIPNNLYFFCTSNYRDDKKIIEDNLLRRFDLIEIYPTYEGVIKETEVAQFLEAMNKSILKHFDKREIHPDRFMIGHASWINAKDEQTFCRALLKAITEFKDIREIEYSDIKPVLDDLKDLPFGLKTQRYTEGGLPNHY